MSDTQKPRDNWNEPIKKKGFLGRIKDVVKPPNPTQRIADDFGILKEVAGLRYLQNIKDLEQRRSEIISILDSIEGQTSNKKMQKKVVERTFRLFFTSGSMWFRGLDNRELTGKVSKFLSLYSEVGHMTAFTHDLFKCSMMLLHLSFQAIDVTNTPAYMIQTTPLVLNLQRGGGSPRFTTPEGTEGDAGQRQE